MDRCIGQRDLIEILENGDKLQERRNGHREITEITLKTALR